VRILYLVGTTLLLLGVVFGSAFVLIAQDSETGPITISVFTLSEFMLILTPILIISLISFQPHGLNADPMRSFRQKLILIGLGVQVLGVTLFIGSSILSSTPIWLVFAVLVVAVALSALTPLSGEHLRRHEQSSNPIDAPWVSLTDSEIPSSRRTVVTFLVTLVVAVPSFSLLLLLDDDSEPLRVLPGILLLALGFALIASLFAHLSISLKLNRKSLNALGPDPVLRRAIPRKVLRGRGEDFVGDAAVRAARYSQVAQVNTRHQLVQLLITFGGILCLRVSSMLTMSRGPSTFDIVFLIALIAVPVVVLPFSIPQLRRVDRYAAEHRDLPV
jgi:hypothetical protein